MTSPAGREALFTALFARVSGITAFAFTSRAFQSWDDTPPAETPAMFMVKGPEESAARTPLPAMRRYTARVVMYFGIAAGTQGAVALPSTQINNALDALDQALALQADETPAAGNRFVPPEGASTTTLGGLCYGVEVDGAIETVEGFIGGGSVCIVPLVLFTTA